MQVTPSFNSGLFCFQPLNSFIYLYDFCGKNYTNIIGVVEAPPPRSQATRRLLRRLERKTVVRRKSIFKGE